ncbi:MAG: hypothetical protein AAGC54_08105 [Cyanobacteria bacterium P01_F01_bin.4]
MAIVADYKHISDKSIDLKVASSEIAGTMIHTFEFHLAEDPVSGEGALIAWNMRRELADSVNYKVEVNGSYAARYTANETDWHAVHENIPSNSIHTGENTVTFEVTSGAGIVSIGDVTLWYRKSI